MTPYIILNKCSKTKNNKQRLERKASFFVVIFDATVVNIAIPSIANQFHATVSDLQWMMAAYMLSFSSLLLLAGYLVDRYGAKKIMLLGLAGFVLASLGCALTQSAPQLIVCRFLQGITGSALIPYQS